MKIYFLTVAALMVVLIGAVSLADMFMKNQPASSQTASVATSTLPQTPPPSNEPLKIFGSIPYWDQARAVSVFKKHVDQFDMISLFWYRLDEDGTIEEYWNANVDESIITFAHAHDVKVLALIANLPEEDDWDHMRVEKVIGDEESRRRHTAAIMELVESKGFDGVNIDYEFLRNRQTENFSAFIAELGEALHRENKILAIAIHPQDRRSPTRGQDMLALAESADILAVMAFDEHWDASQPGPVASIPWVRGILKYTRNLGVPMHKIYLCMPLYGYDWKEEGSGWGVAEGLEYEDVVKLANGNRVEVLLDPVLQSPHFSYTDKNGSEHQVWFENVTSFEAKLKLAKEYGVGGLAFWRLGREDARIYDLLEQEEQ